MQISKKEYERILKEEIDKAIEEGLLDYIKGAGTAAGQKASSAISGVGQKIKGAASSAASSIKNTASDIAQAGQSASDAANKQRDIQNYNQNLVKIQNSLKQLARDAAKIDDLAKEDMALNMAQKLYDLVMVPGEEQPQDIPQVKKQVPKQTPKPVDFGNTPAPIQGLGESSKKKVNEPTLPPEEKKLDRTLKSKKRVWPQENTPFKDIYSAVKMISIALADIEKVSGDPIRLQKLQTLKSHLYGVIDGTMELEDSMLQEQNLNPNKPFPMEGAKDLAGVLQNLKNQIEQLDTYYANAELQKSPLAMKVKREVEQIKDAVQNLWLISFKAKPEPVAGLKEANPDNIYPRVPGYKMGEIENRFDSIHSGLVKVHNELQLLLKELARDGDIQTAKFVDKIYSEITNMLEKVRKAFANSVLNPRDIEKAVVSKSKEVPKPVAMENREK